jgi:hypothetical protein
MVDWLANLAMDTRRSTQVKLDQDILTTEKWKPLARAASQDIGHWMLNNTAVDSTESIIVKP